MESNQTKFSSINSSISTPFQPSIPSQVPIPPKSSFSKIVAWIILIIIVLILVGLGYAYFQKIWPFTINTYSEDNFSSSLLTKIGQINSASYTVSGALNVTPRDQDARPFVSTIQDTPELRQSYINDSKRLKDVSAIISTLNNLSNYSTYHFINSPAPITKPYPTNIKNLFTSNKSRSFGSSRSITDSTTKNDYEYMASASGKNFILTVNFETDDAINIIKKNKYVATTTIISGKKVSFTRDSYSYLSMSAEPPKPFLTKMSESMKSLPPDVNVKTSFSASSQLKPAGEADWTFNLDAEGDFGDLTYKINAETLKKEEDYYFRINNIPSLFLFGDLASIKGKWVKISSKASVETTKKTSSTLSSLTNSIPDVEKKYQENREKFIQFTKKLVTIADAEKVITFKTKPHLETVDGKRLIKYDLRLKREAILPFYIRLQQELSRDQNFSDYQNLIVDQGLINYLQSKDFGETFDYFDKNTNLTLWTDEDGFPVIIQNSIRVVPPDTATQLAGKQIMVTFKLIINNINQSIEIKAPAESIPIEKIINDFNKNNGTSIANDKLSTFRANLTSIRTYAEINYNNNNNSYGKKPFSLGPCQKTSDTLFADANIIRIIEETTNKNMAVATCVSKGSTNNISSYAISVPLPDDLANNSWCVDSQGKVEQITGKITSDVCR